MGRLTNGHQLKLRKEQTFLVLVGPFSCFTLKVGRYWFQMNFNWHKLYSNQLNGLPGRVDSYGACGFVARKMFHCHVTLTRGRCLLSGRLAVCSLPVVQQPFSVYTRYINDNIMSSNYNTSALSYPRALLLYLRCRQYEFPCECRFLISVSFVDRKSLVPSSRSAAMTTPSVNIGAPRSRRSIISDSPTKSSVNSSRRMDVDSKPS